MGRVLAGIAGGLLAGFVTAADAAAEPLVVVISRDVAVERISAEDVGRIYRGEQQLLAGRQAAPVDYEPQVAFREKFFTRVLGTSGARFRTYWLKEVYRSGRVPPVTAASPADALDRVRERPGTVAYVRASDVAGNDADTVRVLLELPCNKDAEAAPVVTPSPSAKPG